MRRDLKLREQSCVWVFILCTRAAEGDYPAQATPTGLLTESNVMRVWIVRKNKAVGEGVQRNHRRCHWLNITASYLLTFYG